MLRGDDNKTYHSMNVETLPEIGEDEKKIVLRE
jgi:hypothetical protein